MKILAMRVMKLALALVMLRGVAALDPISIKGSKFFYPNGTQFYIKGVAYQLDPKDALADAEQCQLDAQLMQQLGINTIRSYRIDPTTNHSACMNEFNAAGIYVLVDLENPTFLAAINESAPEWTTNIMSFSEAVVDAFAPFDNLLGFFASNEIITTPQGTGAAPAVKASVRDVKAYIESRNYRKIPVGYSAADISSIRPMLQNYLACGPTSIDFFGLNIYEWCYMSGINYETSGYADRTAEFSAYPVPVFFSEFGCITFLPRTFDDVPVLLGPQMDGVWSGGIVYEWVQEANAYGLVTIPPLSENETNAFKGQPVPVQPGFNNLQSAFAAANPTGVQSASYSPSVTSVACPASTATVWPVDPNAALPPSPSPSTTSLDWQYYEKGLVPPQTTTTTATASQSASSSQTPQPSNPIANSSTKSNDSTSSSSDASTVSLALSISMLPLLIVCIAILA